MRKFIVLGLIAALCIAGLNLPVYASEEPFAEFAVEPQVIYVTVCSNFHVDVSITKLKGPMWGFHIEFIWDDGMEYVDHEFHHHGDWDDSTLNEVRDHRILITAYGADWDRDESWLTVTFHCTAEGTSIVGVDLGWVRTGTDEKIFLDPAGATVHQSRPPPGISRPEFVGGGLTTANKLAVLGPYLASVGLIGAVSITLALRRRRKA